MTNYYIYYHYKNIVLVVRSFLMQGIQRFMVLVVMFFDFLNDFLALLLQYMTWCTMWRLYMAYVSCKQHLEIFSEI